MSFPLSLIILIAFCTLSSHDLPPTLGRALPPMLQDLNLARFMSIWCVYIILGFGILNKSSFNIFFEYPTPRGFGAQWFQDAVVTVGMLARQR